MGEQAKNTAMLINIWATASITLIGFGGGVVIAGASGAIPIQMGELGFLPIGTAIAGTAVFILFLMWSRRI